MRAKTYRRRSSRQKRKHRSWMPLALLVVGVLLLGAGAVAYVSSSPSATASTEFQSGEVAEGQPIRAIHEMGEGPPIPFLPRSQAQPEIQVPEKFYDFGVIGPRDIVEREFVIRNVGQAPLTISRAYTTCGCTTAEISTNVIPPGRVATVKIVFDAGFHDTAGQTVRRGLIIENNDPEHSQAEIWIQAQVNSS